MPDKPTDDDVKYLDEDQADFIKECEVLLQRAREGKIIGVFGFEFTTDLNIEPLTMGTLPEDLSAIASLHALAADFTASMAVDRTFDAMGEAET